MSQYDIKIKNEKIKSSKLHPNHINHYKMASVGRQQLIYIVIQVGIFLLPKTHKNCIHHKPFVFSLAISLSHTLSPNPCIKKHQTQQHKKYKHH